MDKEKVIKGLRICFMQKDCDGCPYQKELKAILDKPHNDDWHCPILDDVIAVLKEQEAEIRQLRLALDIGKGTCNGIKVEGSVERNA